MRYFIYSFNLTQTFRDEMADESFLLMPINSIVVEKPQRYIVDWWSDAAAGLT